VPQSNQHFFNNSFHVTMTEHPQIHHTGLWNIPAGSDARKQSLIMVRDFDVASYAKIEEDDNLQLMSEAGVYSYLQARKKLFNIEDRDILFDFLDSEEEDHKIVLVNRLMVDIPMIELRFLLGTFDFYFALPGDVMPFSQNISEAMLTGTIPFIQEGYAGMFKPALIDGINAITFSDKSGLEEKLYKLFTMSAESIELLRGNVYKYYNDYLTPPELPSYLKSQAASL
jgi:hypothetical protein